MAPRGQLALRIGESGAAAWVDLAWTYILAFHFGLRVEPAAAFKLSSSPRRAAHASHSCERRPTRTAVQFEQRGDASIPGGCPATRRSRDET